MSTGLKEEKSTVTRLPFARNNLRMTDGARTSTYQERDDLARRLDLLQADLNRYR